MSFLVTRFQIKIKIKLKQGNEYVLYRGVHKKQIFVRDSELTEVFFFAKKVNRSLET